MSAEVEIVGAYLACSQRQKGFCSVFCSSYPCEVDVNFVARFHLSKSTMWIREGFNKILENPNRRRTGRGSARVDFPIRNKNLCSKRLKLRKKTYQTKLLFNYDPPNPLPDCLDHPIPQGSLTFVEKPYRKASPHSEEVEWWRTFMVEWGGVLKLYQPKYLLLPRKQGQEFHILYSDKFLVLRK